MYVPAIPVTPTCTFDVMYYMHIYTRGVSIFKHVDIKNSLIYRLSLPVSDFFPVFFFVLTICKTSTIRTLWIYGGCLCYEQQYKDGF